MPAMLAAACVLFLTGCDYPQIPSDGKLTVCEIVLDDGNIIRANHIAPWHKERAVAVIFDEEKKLGIGVNVIRGDKRERICLASSYARNNVLATNMYDGKLNTDLVKALDDYDKDYYPAFSFCTNYSAGDFKSGWYMPSLGELKTIYANREAIENAFEVLGRPNPFKHEYKDMYNTFWSSTQVPVINTLNFAAVHFSDGSITHGGIYASICAVRKFGITDRY